MFFVYTNACMVLGFEDWLTNPDFNTADARDRHKQVIGKRIGGCFLLWATQLNRLQSSPRTKQPSLFRNRPSKNYEKSKTKEVVSENS